MRKIRTLAILSSIMMIFATIGVASAVPPKYSYAAKFVCGEVAGTWSVDSPLAPGHYNTAINLHNPWWYNIWLWKKAVVTYEEGQWKAPSRKINYTVKPDYGFEINCKEIKNWLWPYPQTPPAWFKGFVVIESPYKLDVTGVYTTHHPTSGYLTEDVEQINYIQRW